MYLRDECRRGAIVKGEDCHGVALRARVVPVRCVQEWRPAGATVTIAAAAVARVHCECGREQQFGGDAVAERFTWLELESRHRAEEFGRVWEWREMVREEVAREFADGVQDVICAYIHT